ncbi:unnamed protein product [Lampetra planeri]
MLRQLGSLVPRLLRGRGFLVANTASCGALMATGDAVQQWREKRAGSRERRDWVRTARMFSVGIVLGPILHLWYVYLDKFLPERTRKVVAKKILADQLIASPPLAALFFFVVRGQHHPLEMSLSAVQAVEVSHDAIYKYVLVRVHAQDGAAHKDVVRGFPSAEFHADIYDKLSAEVERLGLDCECLGGGRIQHDSVTKTIKVYGHSIGFGKADHSVTTEKLKTKYPDYTITHSDEGY